MSSQHIKTFVPPKVGAKSSPTANNKAPPSIDSQTKALRKTQTIPKGQTLFEEGDQGGGLIFVRKGRVAISRLDGDQRVTIATMGPGEIIGIMSALEATPRTATATAITELEVEIVPSDSVLQAMDKVPSWMRSVVKDLIARVLRADERYIQASKIIREQQGLTENLPHLTRQIIAAAAHFAEVNTQPNDAPKESIAVRISALLLVPLDLVEEIFDILRISGVFGMENRVDLNRTNSQSITPLQMSALQNFVKETSDQQKLNRYLELGANLLNGDRRAMQTLALHFATRDPNLENFVRIPEAQAIAAILKSRPKAQAQTHINHAKRAGILNPPPGEEEATQQLYFIPRVLWQEMAIVITLKRLEILKKQRQRQQRKGHAA